MKLFMLILLLFSLVLPALAADPCQNALVTKSIAPINIVTFTGTTTIIPAVTGKTVYLCGYQYADNSGNASARFNTGTQTTNPCDTGTQTPMGPMNLSSLGVVATMPANMTVITSLPGAALCMVTGSGTPSFGGAVIYVQQ